MFTPVWVGKKTEQSDAIIVAVHDDVVEVGLAVLIDCEFVGFETLDGLLLLFSSGLLGFSGLLGVLASLGLLPEPPPLISPPPSGGQKGHTQEGLRSPNPPVPPDHLPRSLVPRSTTNSTQANVPGSARSYYNNCSSNRNLTVIAIGLDYRYCHRYGGPLLFLFLLPLSTKAQRLQNTDFESPDEEIH